MTSIQCPTCGTVCKTAAGLQRHQQGERCRVLSQIREYQQRGQVPVNRPQAALLLEAKVPCQKGYTNYHPGSKGRAARVTEGVWVDPIYTTILQQTKGRPRAERLAWLRVATTLEARTTIDAHLRLTGTLPHGLLEKEPPTP